MGGTSGRGHGYSRLACFGFDVELCDLQEQVAHFVELICAFGDGAGGFEAGDEAGEDVEVGRVAVEEDVAKDDDEGGEWGREDRPGKR